MVPSVSDLVVVAVHVAPVPQEDGEEHVAAEGAVEAVLRRRNQ